MHFDLPCSSCFHFMAGLVASVGASFLLLSNYNSYMYIYRLVNPLLLWRTMYVYDVVMANREIILNSAIVYDRDFQYDYFSFKTLEKSYLLKIRGEIAKRPQHMIMRVALGIHKVRDVLFFL